MACNWLRHDSKPVGLIAKSLSSKSQVLFKRKKTTDKLQLPATLYIVLKKYFWVFKFLNTLLVDTILIISKVHLEKL